ncbi:hypothetical protein PoB_003372700 [Plakobranchus ocellatus]|uniref:Uncharacterized protein n=1 Tax=Plakobranchus ocellatus TaxID=259542 RepID=A0AAV4AIY0_9GAST|nr:hypothetical protein PoB_003372700 [Plakobranchus ocellatus]
MGSNCTFPAKEDFPELLLQHLTFFHKLETGITREWISGPSLCFEINWKMNAPKGPVEKCRRRKLCGTDLPPFGGYKTSKSVSDKLQPQTDSEAACEAAAKPPEESCQSEQRSCLSKRKIVGLLENGQKLSDNTAHDDHAAQSDQLLAMFVTSEAMESQWQHSVPRSLRMETNFQTNSELFNSNTLHGNGFKDVQRRTFLLF